jgi:hypothetical protein
VEEVLGYGGTHMNVKIANIGRRPNVSETGAKTRGPIPYESFHPPKHFPIVPIKEKKKKRSVFVSDQAGNDPLAPKKELIRV